MAEATQTYNLLKPLKEDYGTISNFVDGEFVAPQTDRFLDITSPLDGKVIGKVPLSTKAEVDKAVKAAHDAFWDWRSTPPLDRARCRCRASFCALMEATVVAGSVTQYNALTEGG